MSLDGDGVGAWPTGSHNEGPPLDVDALDEATRSQFEFLRQRRERIRSLLADGASSQRPQPRNAPAPSSTPPRRVRVRHRDAAQGEAANRSTRSAHEASPRKQQPHPQQPGRHSGRSNASPTVDDDDLEATGSGGGMHGHNSSPRRRSGDHGLAVGVDDDRGGPSPLLTPKPTLFVDDERARPPEEPIHVVPGDPFDGRARRQRGRRHDGSVSSTGGSNAARPGSAPASVQSDAPPVPTKPPQLPHTHRHPHQQPPKPPMPERSGVGGAGRGPHGMMGGPSAMAALDEVLNGGGSSGGGGGSAGAGVGGQDWDDEAQMEGLMAMLDQADSRSGKLIESAKQPPPHPPHAAASRSASSHDTPPRASRLAVNVFGGVKAKLQAMSLELETKTRTIATLQGQNRALKAQVEDTKQRAAAAVKERVEKAKQVGASTAARHLAFIDRLLADKAALAKRVEELEAAASDAAAAAEAKLKAVQDRQAVDLQRARQQWAAAEKARRVKWEAEREKAIKALTIKGLEPELQRMLDKNKEEIARVKELAAVEVRRQREVMEAKFHDQRLRQQEAVDTAVAAALNKERDLALEARKTMVEQYEEQLSKMRERLAGEMDAEHRRIGESHRAQARRHAEELDRVRALADRRVEDVQKRLNHEREDTARRIAAAINTERERANIEREAWQHRQMNQLKKEAKEAEKETKASLIRQRDEQVKMVIKRLDEETEAAMQRLKDDHARAMDDAATSHATQLRTLRDELEDTRTQLHHATRGATDAASQRDEELARARAEAKALTRKLASTDAACATLRADLADARATAAREKAAAEVSAEEDREAANRRVSELQRLLNEARASASQAEADAAAQVARVKQSKAEELESVANRVRDVLKRRDKVIAELKASLEEARAAQSQTEALLEKQRRELLELGDDDG